MDAKAPGPVWVGLGAVVVVFHIGLIGYGLAPNLVARPIHLALALPFALILTARSAAGRISGGLIAAAGVAACAWVAWNADALGDQYGYLESDFQLGVAVVLLLVTLEAARRSIGWPLPAVALLALGHALLGHHIPGEFGHAGAPVESVLGALTIAETGLWGQLTGVSVGVVAVFVIFGAILNAGEAGQGFMNLAAAAAGRLKGGAAKVSILSSALFGSISGSASANVASTGAVTLPAMIRLGYPKRIAGAVEAVASSGGQITPPLMGAGAFVMVELTGVAYADIVVAAALPAFLYFFAVWMGVNAYAARYALPGLSAAETPRRRQVLITSGFFILPFGVLLGGMFGAGVTPPFAAAAAALLAALLLAVDAELTIDFKRMGRRAAAACLAAGRQVAMIASIILCASIVVGVLALTGLGVKLTSLILESGGGGLWAALLLTALACLILGMEVPTTAAYVICVSVAGPALTALGMDVLLAHLFVFWFALLSTITPPVCGAVFIAAGMVGENWLRVAGVAMALGLGLYVIPLGMAADPTLIGLSDDPGAALLAALRIALGLGVMSAGVIRLRGLALKLAAVAAGAAVVVVAPALV